MKEFSNLVLKALSNCSTFKCCGSLHDEPCERGCRGICHCLSCLEIRQKLPTSVRYFALQTLCWPSELKGASKNKIKNWVFNRNCWTGKCLEPNCLKLSPFFALFRKLLQQSQDFKFWKFQELERESLSQEREKHHGFIMPYEVLSTFLFMSMRRN